MELVEIVGIVVIILFVVTIYCGVNTEENRKDLIKLSNRLNKLEDGK